MSDLPERYRCDRVRKNNGMVEFHFTRRDGLDQDNVVLVNLHVPADKYVVGEYYWIGISPASPR